MTRMTRPTGSVGEWPASLITLAALAALLAPCLLVAACAGARHSAASAKASPARPVTPEAVMTPKAAIKQQDGGAGLRLLQEAAKAGSDTSYQGVELVSAWGVDGDSTMLADVWHRSGGSTLVRTAAAGTISAGQPNVSDDTDSRAPEGVLGLTGKLVVLLGANYDVGVAGAGSADSRPAQVVEARREDGRLAALFWLDKATKLPLRREVFDSGAHLIGEDVFIDLKIGASAAAAAPEGYAAPGTRRLSPAELAALQARGWPVPGTLPDGLALFEAGEAATRSGRVLDLGYSDGLFVVSVFVQRGALAPKLAGWEKISLDGREMYAGQPDRRSLSWAGQGYVFTVMADAPPATLDRAVNTLPYSSPPGFWTRLSRGFARLGSWVNPFR
jgi:sigma-E factor negative regulatory protein RseB